MKKGIHGNKSHAGEPEEPEADGWGNPGGWPWWFQWSSSVLPSFGNERCFYATWMDFSQALTRVLTLGSHEEVGVCTSPKHHPMALYPWAHLYSLLIQTSYLFGKQQCFCPWFTGVMCSQDLSGCLVLFLHCWLGKHPPPTPVDSQPFPHSHHKQFPWQITPKKIRASNPCLQQDSKISSWLWCHCCNPVWPCCPCKHLWFAQWWWGGVSLEHRSWRY